MNAKLLIVIALIVPMLSAISYAVCDPLKCPEQSRITGSTYCKDGNVYSPYLDYYCSYNECVSRAGEKIIEQCNFGCSVGTCITCNQTACQEKNGFYGGRFCRDNDVRSIYRDYSCSSDKGCDYTETERTVETCKDSTCTEGKCGLCDPSVCNSRDGFYDEDYCNIDNDVYKVYRDYSCDLDRCVFKRAEIKMADCSFNCEAGKCTATLCDAGCDSRDGFAGQPYCKGNDVYRKFRDYFCKLNNCDFNETERKVESCASCANGSCVVAPAVIKERLLEFNLTFSSITEDVKITRQPGRVYNGFLFGKNDIAINMDAFLQTLNFAVTGTNKLGALEVSVDGAVVLTADGRGSYSVPVNKYAKSVRISATSSGFVFWVPALYDLNNIELMARQTKIPESISSFIVGPEYAKFRYGDILLSENITAFLNGNMVTKNAFGKNFLKLDENEIKFVSKGPLSGKAALRIAYEE
ncbi:MAG: hypothetical protein HYT72_03910 [Candidatus Aenigmarchaeota archaeon]|nr:hypothetical protein [Candidatus Aenigmarchaeota archaeon]